MAIKKFNANSVSGGLVSGATVSSSAPSAPSNGALWLNSSTGALLTYYDSGSNTQWLQPVSPTGAVGATGAAGAAGAPGEAGVSVVISSIVLTDSSYATITDTSLSLTGGYIRILGTGFVSGCNVVIDNSVATSVTFVNSTEIRAQLPAKVAGTYILYVSNPSGAVAIRVNAITFSATPSWVTTSPLSGSSNVPVSIQLSVASDSTVSYVLQAGSTLPTGLTLSSSGLLSGTVTGITLLTTYNFTIVATDLESQTSPKAFSITISVSEPYFNSTVLLLQGDVTPFTADASTNKFEISPVGTPSANTNNPLQPGYYSGSFNGSSDRLSIPASSNVAFGTGAFTVEFWINPNSFSDYQYIIDTRTTSSGGGGGFAMYSPATGLLVVAIDNTGTISASTALTVNKWQHIAVSSTGTSVTLYLNGISIGSGTYSANITATSCNIATWYAINSFFYNGYISNLRIVKGVTVYTGAFTPPTSPLAATQTSGTNIAAITGTATSLLTLQSYSFIDNSTYQATLTPTGTPDISVTQPFTLPSPYTGYGAGLFNGTTDYLQSPSNAALTLGTSDFTIEAWVYLTVAGSASVLGPVWDGRPSVNGAYPYLLVQGNSTNYNVAWYVNATNQVTAPTLALNTWHHIAYSRSYATAGRLFVNGALIQSWVDNVNYLGSQGRIGSNYDASGLLGGYISNLRITKGVAVYTGAFTPPTDPLTTTQSSSGNIAAITGTATSLLTLQTNQAQNNNQFRDSSTNNFTVTRTGTPTQGTFTPFSQTGWSGYFNSTSANLTMPYNINLTLYNTICTVECWLYLTAWPSIAVPIYGNTVWDNSSTYCSLQLMETGYLRYVTRNMISIPISTATVPLNQWVHVAWNRTGTNGVTYTFYINGVAAGTGSMTGTGEEAWSSALSIGVGNFVADRYIPGYISNLRVVKGVAVYTGAFTPPTAPLAATQSAGTNITAITGTATSLLTLQSNRFKDNSTNNFTITAFGTTSIQSFSPFAPAAAYSASTGGGSIYFPGSSNLLVPSNASLALGTVDFTIEMWVYNTSTTNRLISYATATSPIIYINSSNYVQYDNYGVGGVLTSSILTPLNTWNHIAIVRLSATSKIYINGVQGASGSDTNNWGQSGIYIGVDVATTFMTGYMSSLRIVKGTAVYTATFTPPTAPLTAIAGTSLLLNATNSGIFDATGKNDLITVGDARVSTSKQKYGSGAMYFDGTGDYLSLPNNPNLAFGTGNFTIEMWINLSALSGVDDGVFWEARSSGATSTGFVFNARSSGGGYVLNCYTDSGANLGSTVIAFNTWNHIALVRNGSATGNLKFYIGGLAEAVVITKNNNFSDIPIVTIGQSTLYGNSNITGYIDDLRITKGIARYTATFTPPASAALNQ